MVKKNLCILFMAAAMAFGVNASAQTKDIENSFSAFNSIEASNDFEVTLVFDENYSSIMTVDEQLADYVKAYVKGKTLFIELDEKSVPKETKKAYSAKGAQPPVLRAVVHLPEISAITIADNVVLSSTEPINSDKFTLSVAGNAQVKLLNVNSRNATLNASKKTSVNMTVSSDDITVNTDNQANFKLSYDCKTLTLTPSGSSILSLSGEAHKIDVKSEGSSKTTLTGAADEISFTGKGSSEVDATALKVDDAVVNLSNSSTVKENAGKSLKIELTGNSNLFFGGKPAIDIVSIKSSTVQHL